MTHKKTGSRIAILGGGPSALFIFKRLVESGDTDLEIHIFEIKKMLGAGMPYSYEGANKEHVTNVSDNEIPEIVTSIETWIQTLSKESLARYDIDKKNFNEFKVLPRLLFGQYLSAQFTLLLEKAKAEGLKTIVHLGSKVIDIVDKTENGNVEIETADKEILRFDKVIICTGHKWPLKYEGLVPGYFDSPYPPAKLELKLNHPVALKGSSLTAVDAIRTLARNNGTFEKDKSGRIRYKVSADSPEFRLVMHSRNGLLPAVRFHLEDPLVSNDSLLTQEEIQENKAENNGFLSLDFVFEKEFKDMFKEKDPQFYRSIKDLSMEDFVESMMSFRENAEPFALFKAEYEEAEQSIRRKQSIYWKEVLAILSFAMNYPAKYLSAEDMQRLQKVLMPLISVVIAFVPQSSCEELLALHEAGRLEIIAVGETGEAVADEKNGGINYNYTNEKGEDLSVYFKTFIDCVGQPHLDFEAFPFTGLYKNETISPARIKFRSAEKAESAIADGNKNVVKQGNAYYLKVPGITINDNFQIVNAKGKANDRIYIMAVPYIGGYNPDYSGLDFCEQASENIVDTILNKSVYLEK